MPGGHLLNLTLPTLVKKTDIQIGPYETISVSTIKYNDHRLHFETVAFRVVEGEGDVLHPEFQEKYERLDLDDALADHAKMVLEAEKLEPCGAQFVTRGQDPCSTECEESQGHYPDTPHKGLHPCGLPGTITWRGGGYVMGDRLPYRDVTGL